MLIEDACPQSNEGDRRPSAKILSVQKDRTIGAGFLREVLLGAELSSRRFEAPPFASIVGRALSRSSTLGSFGTSGLVIIARPLSSTDVERGKSVPTPMAGEARLTTTYRQRTMSGSTSSPRNARSNSPRSRATTSRTTSMAAAFAEAFRALE
jgi:hypothetical protein